MAADAWRQHDGGEMGRYDYDGRAACGDGGGGDATGTTAGVLGAAAAA